MMLPHNYYRVYAAQKRRQAQAKRDNEFQSRMAMKHDQIQKELNDAFGMLRIGSTHELTMALLTQSAPAIALRLAHSGLSRVKVSTLARPSSTYAMDTTSGLRLYLEIELNRHAEIARFYRLSNEFPYPYNTKTQEGQHWI